MIPLATLAPPLPLFVLPHRKICPLPEALLLPPFPGHTPPRNKRTEGTAFLPVGVGNRRNSGNFGARPVDSVFQPKVDSISQWGGVWSDAPPRPSRGRTPTREIFGGSDGDPLGLGRSKSRHANQIPWGKKPGVRRENPALPSKKFPPQGGLSAGGTNMFFFPVNDFFFRPINTIAKNELVEAQSLRSGGVFFRRAKTKGRRCFHHWRGFPVQTGNLRGALRPRPRFFLRAVPRRAGASVHGPDPPNSKASKNNF